MLIEMLLPSVPSPAALVAAIARALRRELHRISSPDCRAIVKDLDRAERDPSTFMMTPLVLEVIADR